MSNMKYVVVQTDQSVPGEVIEEASFEELREMLGGFVEVVRLGVFIAVIDEEGLYKEDLEPNPLGTILYRRLNGRTPIMGKMIVVGRNFTADGDFPGLDPEWAEEFAKRCEGSHPDVAYELLEGLL